MMEWFKDSVAYARNNKALAIASGLVVVSLFSSGILAARVAVLVDDLRQETDDRIQLACDMSFANGQALLDTAAIDEEIPPETIEAYRKNLQRYANEAIASFDPQFECEIPEETNAGDQQGAQDQESDAEDVRQEEGYVCVLCIGQ